MTYVKSPGGLAFAYMLGGGPQWVRSLHKTRNCKTAIFMDDVVHEMSCGSIEPLNAAVRGTGVPMGVALTAGPASKQTSHLVIMGTQAVFTARVDESVAEEIDFRIDPKANVNPLPGDPLSNMSGHQVDATTISAIEPRDLRLLRELPLPDSSGRRIEVIFCPTRLGLR